MSTRDRRPGRSGKGSDVWAMLGTQLACALAWAATAELVALLAALVASLGLLLAVLRP